MGKKGKLKLCKLFGKWLVAGVFLFTIFAIQATAAKASDIDLIYPNKPNPLFIESGQKPGDVVTKNIIIRNNYSDGRMLGIKGENFSGNTDLAQVLEINLQNSAINFTSTLANIENLETALGQVSPGDSPFSITLTFKIEAGNQYQGNSLTFDLVFGFIEQEPGGPISTTTPPTPDLPGIISHLPSRIVTTLTPAEEITPIVETPIVTEEGKIKGKETETASSMKFRIAWWQWLMAILMALLIFFLLFWRRRREEEDSEEEIKI